MRESMYKTLQLPGSLNGPWTPAIRDFVLRARYVHSTHIIFCTPPKKKKSWIRPCTQNLTSSRDSTFDLFAQDLGGHSDFSSMGVCRSQP